MNKKHIYEKYEEWYNNLLEKHPLKGGVSPREIVYAVCDIIKEEEVMEKYRLIWKCKLCDDVVVSYSHLRHDLNMCECGKSGVDLEQSYTRYLGEVENISYKVYDNKNNKWKNLLKNT